jgi:hypothetical protein
MKLDLNTVPSAVVITLSHNGYTAERMHAMTRREVFTAYCAALELNTADDLWENIETLYRLKTRISVDEAFSEAEAERRKQL